MFEVRPEDYGIQSVCQTMIKNMDMLVEFGMFEKTIDPISKNPVYIRR